METRDDAGFVPFGDRLLVTVIADKSGDFVDAIKVSDASGAVVGEVVGEAGVRVTPWLRRQSVPA